MVDSRAADRSTVVDGGSEPVPFFSCALAASDALFPAGVKCRQMFSITTTVSSMISPIATASPPIDIRFRL